MMHTPKIANPRRSGVMCRSVIGGRRDEVCGRRGPDRRVRKGPRALSVFIQVIIVTLYCLLFGNIDIRPGFYSTLWRPITSLLSSTARRCSSSCPACQVTTDSAEARNWKLSANFPWKCIYFSSIRPEISLWPKMSWATIAVLPNTLKYNIYDIIFKNPQLKRATSLKIISHCL